METKKASEYLDELKKAAEKPYLECKDKLKKAAEKPYDDLSWLARKENPDSPRLPNFSELHDITARYRIATDVIGRIERSIREGVGFDAALQDARSWCRRQHKVAVANRGKYGHVTEFRIINDAIAAGNATAIREFDEDNPESFASRVRYIIDAIKDGVNAYTDDLRQRKDD